jgi:hypothetical protein
MLFLLVKQDHTQTGSYARTSISTQNQPSPIDHSCYPLASMRSSIGPPANASVAVRPSAPSLAHGSIVPGSHHQPAAEAPGGGIPGSPGNTPNLTRDRHEAVWWGTRDFGSGGILSLDLFCFACYFASQSFQGWNRPLQSMSNLSPS